MVSFATLFPHTSAALRRLGHNLGELYDIVLGVPVEPPPFVPTVSSHGPVKGSNDNDRNVAISYLTSVFEERGNDRIRAVNAYAARALGLPKRKFEDTFSAVDALKNEVHVSGPPEAGLVGEAAGPASHRAALDPVALEAARQVYFQLALTMVPPEYRLPPVDPRVYVEDIHRHPATGAPEAGSASPTPKADPASQLGVVTRLRAIGNRGGAPLGNGCFADLADEAASVIVAMREPLEACASILPRYAVAGKNTGEDEELQAVLERVLEALAVAGAPK